MAASEIRNVHLPVSVSYVSLGVCVCVKNHMLKFCIRLNFGFVCVLLLHVK